MELIRQIKNKVKPLGKKIVLPEIEDRRVIEATAQILEEGFAVPVLIGTKSEVEQAAINNDVNLDKAIVIDPNEYEHLEEMIEEFVKIRAKKGMTPEVARETMLTNKLFFAAMLVRLGYADGMVAGSGCPTANVLRAALQVVGTKPGMKTVSSFMIMFTHKVEYGERGLFIFADCGVIPSPTSEQMADIACSAVEKARSIVGIDDPRVALLSFSTKGSASGPEVDKVVGAYEILKERNVDFKFDGEMQLDASIIPDVAMRKAPDSHVAGRANILIFPELTAANIGYKLVQRFAGATAIGPLIQGLAKPIHDLSRGCSTQDIVDVAAVAAMEGVTLEEMHLLGK